MKPASRPETVVVPMRTTLDGLGLPEQRDQALVGGEEAPAGAEDDSRLDEPQADDDEPVDEYGRPEPKADYVVHVYEQKKFKRTIDRPFTPEDAEAFATEYNRTAKSYGRVAVTGKNDAKPKKALDEK